MQEFDKIYEELLDAMCTCSEEEFREKLLTAINNGFDINYQRNKRNIKRTLLTESFIEIDPPACDILRVLISCGADVNIRLNNSRMTPLMICLQGALSRQYEITQILLNAGADVNAQATDGLTAFSICAGWYCIKNVLKNVPGVPDESKFADILKMLLKYGADPNLCTNWEKLSSSPKGNDSCDFKTQKGEIRKIIEDFAERKKEITAQKPTTAFPYEL